VANKIEIKNLYFDYIGKKESFEALEDINLNIKEGEFVCILGSSGCGKSTLLSILNGLNKAKSGEIVIDGEKVSGPGVNRATVFQNYSLFPWKTVKGNVLFGAKRSKNKKNYTKAERNQKVLSYIEKVGLLNSIDKYPYELSGGMQQRVAIARALALEADILPLDEPFSAIDPKLRHELQELVSKLSKEHNKTVVFITHDIDEAILLSDRIVVMEPKRIKEVLEVKLDYPRVRDELIGRSDYDRLYKRLISLFYDNVRNDIDLEVVL
jgi:NitT/TauT family transport system ATP-binding protein